jgi:RimJ/RimL family protein N-acetyltransferase
MIDFNFGVQLCPLNSSHGEIARGWRNSAEIIRWCRQFDLISDRAQLEWLESIHKDPSISMYSIYHDGNFKGVCGLTSKNFRCSHAEFSLYVAPQYQKIGIGKKALKTLLCHAYLNVGLNQVWGEVFDKNPALKMFKELGFLEDGKRRDFYFKDGKLWDATMISMVFNEWKTQEWAKEICTTLSL